MFPIFTVAGFMPSALSCVAYASCLFFTVRNSALLCCTRFCEAASCEPSDFCRAYSLARYSSCIPVSMYSCCKVTKSGLSSRATVCPFATECPCITFSACILPPIVIDTVAELLSGAAVISPLKVGALALYVALVTPSIFIVSIAQESSAITAAASYSFFTCRSSGYVITSFLRIHWRR